MTIVTIATVSVERPMIGIQSMDALMAYRRAQAVTASPGELIVMLYRGALRHTTSGIIGIELDDRE